MSPNARSQFTFFAAIGALLYDRVYVAIFSPAHMRVPYQECSSQTHSSMFHYIAYQDLPNVVHHFGARKPIDHLDSFLTGHHTHVARVGLGCRNGSGNEELGMYIIIL